MRPCRSKDVVAASRTGSARDHLEQLGGALVRGRGLDGVVGAHRRAPRLVEAVEERGGLEVGVDELRDPRERHARVVERDRRAVEHAQPAELEQLGAGRDAEALGLVVASRAARAARARARVGSSPRRRPSSLKLSSPFAGSISGPPVTNVPRPGADSISPSSESAANARRTVVRLTCS